MKHWEGVLKTIPALRIHKANDAEVNPRGQFVLYWMIANRRTVWNYALEHAVDWAKELDRPLVVFEALRSGYSWASDRLHRFIMDGMGNNLTHLKNRSVTYYPYVEPKPDAGKGLLEALAKEACIIVTDDFPAFFLPRMVSSVSPRLPVKVVKIDGNGVLPMRATDRLFPTAYVFRRFLQKNLPDHLVERPKTDPLKGAALRKLHSLPKKIIRHWPKTSEKALKGDPAFLRSLPIDHKVGEVITRGGSVQARKDLQKFLEDRLTHYAEKRNQPEEEVTSGLSPYLHFGHISVHEIFHELMKYEDWFFDRLSTRASGGRSGWWGMHEYAEAFLDELITWRELGFNMCWQRQDYDLYQSLPDWALTTLAAHKEDKRLYLYTLEEFENAETHDPLWNAAQIQLYTEGRIHNYLRMLWGKKILHWSSGPQKALRIMIELNNKYALDGRDPNSYSGIFWVLGRYDRAWGPERPVFGKVRYMSSENTARKVRVRNYIKKYSASHL
jgi:deoxyribodipyrimidine photo-lyase